MAEVKLNWVNRVQADEVRVYRDTSTFDVNSLPSILATLGASVETYDDPAAPDGTTVYYGVAAVKTDDSPDSIALSSVISVSTVGAGGGSSGSSVSPIGIGLDYETLSGMTVDGAWGLRRMVGSYTGPLVRIRDTNDDSEQDVGADENGDLDSFTVVGTAKVVRVYDQSGNENDLIGSNGGVTTYQPTLDPTGGPSGVPAIDFAGGSQGLELESTVPTSPASGLADANPTWALAMTKIGDLDFEVVAVIPALTDGWGSPFYEMGILETNATDDLETRDGDGTFSSWDAGSASDDHCFVLDGTDGSNFQVWQDDSSNLVVNDPWSGAKTYANAIQIRVGMREADNTSNSWGGKFYELCAMSGGTLTADQRATILQDYLATKWA